jgi:hypothetical protein
MLMRVTVAEQENCREWLPRDLQTLETMATTVPPASARVGDGHGWLPERSSPRSIQADNWAEQLRTSLALSSFRDPPWRPFRSPATRP